MAKMSEAEVDSLTGVLHPKMIHRFRVLFSTGDTQLDILTRQTISVSGIVQSREGSGNINIRIQDDATSASLKAIQQLWKLPSFGIKIEHLDGNTEILCTYSLTKCCLTEIAHSDLDYAGGHYKVSRFILDTKSYDGNLIRDLSTNPMTAALVALLNGARFTFEDSTPPPPACVEHVLQISYRSLDITF